MCRQSSMPTSILMGLFDSGYEDSVCTQMSISRNRSVIRRTTVIRRKYRRRTFEPAYTSYGFSTFGNSNGYSVFCNRSPGRASSRASVRNS